MEVLEIHNNIVECDVLVEKILKVKEGYSIVKNIFCNGGGKK
jgi:hypothetical protein